MLLYLSVLALSAIPVGMGRANLRAVADSEPILTTEALTRMSAFWAALMQEPDSIKTAGRKANREQLQLTVAGQRMTWPGVVNIVAMARQYPAVAADLKRAGLTARQWEAYRGALVEAWIAQHPGVVPPVPAHSILARNVAFLNARPQEFGALQAAGMGLPNVSKITALRLSVRPRTMATGTHTDSAGLQQIDARGDSLLRRAYVYVPPQAVGTRRAPLVVLLHGGNMDGRKMIKYENVRALADQYGFIILAPSSSTDGYTWDLDSLDGRKIDVALRYVLQHYAIDPTRVTLAGSCDGGRWALYVGLVNGDVFDRILSFSPALWEPRVEDDIFLKLPRHGNPPLFVQHGTQDFDAHDVVQWLRHEGYTVTYGTDPGMHGLPAERATIGFRWLAASWPGGAQGAGQGSGSPDRHGGAP